MRARWVVLPVLLAALAVGVMVLRRPAPRTEGSRLEVTRLFEQVFSKVKNASVDPLDDQELYRRAAAGVIEELDDPYAVLLLPGEHPPPPDDSVLAQGVYLDRRDGAVVIVATVAGSPADSAGIQSGDRLIGVDSIPVAYERIDRVPGLLEGQPGTSVNLRIRRSGTRGALSLSLVRGPVPPSPPVRGEMLGGGVASIRVTEMVPGIADSMRRLLNFLRGEGARSLVLDFRSSVGGTLQDAIAVADLFLDQGKLIALTRGRSGGSTERFTDLAASPFREVPIAVLIDGGTAGAAEVVAGALQDHDRAAVLGTNSFGRGVTQSTFRLGEGVSLSLTTSLWITPSGRQIQRPPRPASGDTLPRPTVKSEAGRVLTGGGGIVPDRQIAEGAHGDLALAEAKRVLMRASTPEEVLAQLKEDPAP